MHAPAREAGPPRGRGPSARCGARQTARPLPGYPGARSRRTLCGGPAGTRRPWRTRRRRTGWVPWAAHEGRDRASTSTALLLRHQALCPTQRRSPAARPHNSARAWAASQRAGHSEREEATFSPRHDVTRTSARRCEGFPVRVIPPVSHHTRRRLTRAAGGCVVCMPWAHTRLAPPAARTRPRLSARAHPALTPAGPCAHPRCWPPHCAVRAQQPTSVHTLRPPKTHTHSQRCTAPAAPPPECRAGESGWCARTGA